MRQGLRHRWRHGWGREVAYFAAFLLSLVLGRLLSVGPEGLAVVAPSVGVGAMWMARERRPRDAARVLGLALALGIVVRLGTGLESVAALSRTGTEATCAVVGALVLRRLLPYPLVLERLRAAVVLGLASLTGGATAAAVIWALDRWSEGVALAPSQNQGVVLVAVRDALGLFLVGALVMAWRAAPRPTPHDVPREVAEDLLALGAWVGIFALVDAPQLFLTLPVTLLVALRSGVLRTTVHVGVAAAGTIAMTWGDVGPFAPAASTADVELIEAYLGVLGVAGLLTATLIAEQRRDRHAAQAATLELRRIVDTALVAQMTLVVHDRSAVIVQANPAAGALFRCTPEDLLFRSLVSLVAPQHRDVVATALDTVRTGAPYWSGEVQLGAPDDQARWVLVSVARMPGPDRPGDGEERFTVQLLDITARLELEQELAYAALHDRLTGCANRALMVDRVAMALSSARRADRPVALVFVDLDLFKAVNDTFGHAAGDVVLATVAGRLQRASREVDTVARLGGDEFVFCAPDVDGEAEAESLARRLGAVVAEPLVVAGQEVAVTASIGVALSAPGSTVESLLAEADAAMYEAKRRGRGRVERHRRQTHDPAWRADA